MKDGLSIYFEFLILLFNIEERFDVNAHSDLPKGDAMYDSKGLHSALGRKFLCTTHAKTVIKARSELIANAVSEHDHGPAIVSALQDGYLDLD